MVKSIVIPHDETRRTRLQEMADIGAFQEAVDGSLEIIEVPGMGATRYVNEAAHRDFAPLNTRAMALTWLYAVDPMRHPLLFGDVGAVWRRERRRRPGGARARCLRSHHVLHRRESTRWPSLARDAGAVRHRVRGCRLVHVADALRSTRRPVPDPSARALLQLRSGDHLSGDSSVARGRRSSISDGLRCSSHNIWAIATARSLPHN